MNVQYIARITCACGVQCEVPAEMGSETRGGSTFRAYDVGVFECSAPDGWLGGFDEANPYICPACVKVKYA